MSVSPRARRSRSLIAGVALTALLASVVGGVVVAGPALAAPPEPTFTQTAAVPAPSNSISGEIADIDEDGNLDLFTRGTNAAQVNFGDGLGGFTRSVSVGINGQSYDGAVGDINADGNLDLVFDEAPSGVLLVRAYLGAGDGTFAATPLTLVSNIGSRGIELGDFDADGDLDLIAGNGSSLALYLNSGTGVFNPSAAATFSTGGEAYDPSAADINGDGRLDLVAPLINGTLAILTQSAITPLTFAQVSYPTSGGSVGAGVADIDKDGDQDIVVGSFSSELSLFLNNGAAAPVFTRQLVTSNGAPSIGGYSSGAVADYNLDGALDIASLNRSTGAIAIFLNNNDGLTPLSFTRSTTPLPVTGSSNAYNTFSADFNKDGSPDIFVPNFSTLNTVYTNTSVPPAAPPVLTTQPASQTVNEGEPATFTAEASGIPTPTLQWQVSTDGGTSFTDIADATATTYTFTTSYADNSNLYQAVFINASGTATSAAATLTVRDAPAVTVQPADEIVSAGETASFSAAASGDPAPSVQWEVSTNDGASFTVLAGATSTTYSFTAAAADNSNLYRASFTNAAGFVLTTAARLTVLFAPAITQEPTDQSVNSGELVSFTAAASGNPAPAVQWQVSTDGILFTNIAGATSPTYAFTAAFADDGNSYRAVFSNSEGSATSNAAALAVTADAPVMVDQPANESVVSGETASFSASASGDPAPSVQWERSSDAGASFTPISGATATSYAFTARFADDGDLFRAVFTNSEGSTTSNTASLAVAALAPALSTQPASQTVASGQSATFTAAASGDPAPSVQWEISRDGGVSFTAIVGATSSSYTTPTTTVADSGSRYRAVFSNSAGAATSAAAILTVSATSPSFSDQPDSQSVSSGETATFTVAASGDPAPSIQWQVSTDDGVSFQSIAGATSTSYSLTASYADNSNRYRAVATNSTGSTVSGAATLTVAASTPVVSDQPDSQTATAGEPITLTASASADPTPSSRWQVSRDAGATFADIPGSEQAPGAGVSVMSAGVSARGTQVASYTFTPQISDNGALFRAVFTNVAGSTNSAAATITVVATSVVTVEPQDQTVGVGETATFTAAALGLPVPSIQWQISEDGGATFTDIAGATAESYTTPPTRVADSGNLYRAVFSNAEGSATTRAALLTVTFEAPSVPRNVRAVQTRPGEVTVTWDEPAVSGSSAITGYDVGYGSGESGNGETVSASTRSRVFSGLANGDYMASVVAINSEGRSEPVRVSFSIVAESEAPDGGGNGGGRDGADGNDAGGPLPATGADSALSAALGALLVLLGGALTGWAYRRRLAL